MKQRCEKIKAFLKSNKWIIIGFVLVSLFVFSNFLYGFKLSFTNLNYSFAPYDSYGVKTDGPLLSDIADSEYPLIYKIFYSGTGFSLWDSDWALGAESNTIAELINPMKWVYVLPFEIAAFLKLFSEFAIAFFAMYIFMKSIGVKKFSASMSGAIYSFSAVIVVWLGWPHSDLAAIAPFLFYAFETLMSTMKIKYMLLEAFVIFMMLIVGMPPYAAYFLYLAGVYIVIFTIIRHWQNKRNIFIVGGMFAVGVVIAGLLSLPYTLSLVTNVVSNGYSESRAGYAEAKLTFDYLRTFIFPNTRNNLALHTNESTLFLGAISIFALPLCAFGNKNKKRNIFFIVSSLVVFCLIFTDIFNFIYTRLPLINTSLKYRVITLLMFTMSVMTGISLNDILENKEYYKKKKWIFAVLGAWIAGVLYLCYKNVYTIDSKAVKITILIALAFIACVVFLTLFAKKNYKIVCAVLAVIMLFDCTRFVKEYLPWIDAKADMIPKPSDSVSYMMENTKDEERVVGIGGWTLFPNTPSYYELNDIRVHNFVVTNPDMVEYYKSIDDTIYTTKTRTVVTEIDNYELLKYLGVKYIYGTTLGINVPLAEESAKRFVVGPFESGTVIAQDIEIEEDLSMLQILFATYGNVPTGNETVKISLANYDFEVVYEKDINITEIQDNTCLNLDFSDVNIPKDTYTLTLAFGNLDNQTITNWLCEDKTKKVNINGEALDATMVINTVYKVDEYDIVFTGDDRMLVAELNEYANKAELIENVYVCNNEKDVLSKMSEDYVENTIFAVSSEISEGYNLPLTENESIEIEEYDDDYVKIVCDCDYDRYVSLCDYYNKDWVCYVNGNETEIEKVNYLTRAVKVNKGDDIIIEFKYKPTMLYAVTVVFIVVLLAAVLMFVFRNKLQKKLDKIIK